jgi:hypothetical protein
MRLRRLIIATHRDVGYFFAGLTVLYAISGIAVNHIEHWNPSYELRTEIVDIGELSEGSRDAIADELLGRMRIDEVPRSVVRMSPDQLKIFLENRPLTVWLSQGRVEDERARRRIGFFEVNYLHLNHGKGIWTWFADVYAAGLLILACTGIFIITGKKGLSGRGLWLLLAGLSIPVAYLIFKVWGD